MSIKPKALVISAGAGLVLQAAILVVNVALGIFIASAGSSSGSEGLLALVGVMGAVSCVCALVIDLLVGGAYSYFYSQESPVTVGAAALGGGIAGVIARFIISLCSLCANFGLMPLIASQTSAAAASASLMGSTMGGIVGICVGVVVGALLGAVGGALGGALLRNRSTAV